MKSEEDAEKSPADSTKNDDKPHEKIHVSDSPQPSSSKDFVAPNSPDSEAQTKDDKLFEPTVDMLVNDFDEEQTLEEEEALAAKEHVDPTEELSDLQREGDMPIEELLKLYGCPPPAFNTSSGSRKRRRRQERGTPRAANPDSTQESATVSSTVASSDDCPVAVSTTSTTTITEENPVEEAAEESPDEDGATTATTNTTNYIENQSIDEETNFDDDEPSELKKLYTGLYERDNGELKLEVDDDDDLDYIPDEEEGKKTIMIGAEYQAIIPDGLLKYDDALPYENEDKLLWDPSKVKDDDIEDYLFKFTATANGGTNHSATQGASAPKHSHDDEQALFLLVQCGNNFDEALRRRRLGSVVPNNTMSIWSEEECRNFESGLRLYGKSFHEIQASKVTTRSVGEIVEFYYLWKKTERADIFTAKARLEKKKCNINPCVTDLMEKYLEEYDNRERDRSVSPNVNSNSLLQADTKRHRESSSGHNNRNQHSPDKLMKQQQIDEGAAIKNE